MRNKLLLFLMLISIQCSAINNVLLNELWREIKSNKISIVLSAIIMVGAGYQLLYRDKQKLLSKDKPEENKVEIK